METRIELKQGWKILQDVHDTGEKIGLYAAREADTSGTLFSLEVMIIRISVRTEDINLIPVVPKRFKHEGSTDRSVSEIDRHDIHLFLNVIYFGETYYTIMIIA